jgi:monoamine oxidase
VEWKRGKVSVSAVEESIGRRVDLLAKAAVVALPLGVLKSTAGKGAVLFRPRIAAKRAVIARMGMGRVVRMAFRFSKCDWRRLVPAILRRRSAKGFGFLHSVEPGMPVWWSLSGQPVIVGWAGGPPAEALSALSVGQRRRLALRSLAKILGVRTPVLTKAVGDMVEWDWNGDPYSRGAYSFTAAGQDDAAKKLAQPVRGTLFFAGEATAEGSEVGTVHGALASGKRAARQVLHEFNRRRGR